MAKEIKTETSIQASAERVWEVLTDFKNYPHWNPFIKSISGEAIVGSRIKVHIVPPGKNGMKISPRVLAFEKPKEFRWKGHLLFPGLFDGEHIFEVVGHKNETCTLIHREKFNGILIPLFAKMLDVNTLNGFKLMNQKLKEVSEAK